MDETLEYSYDIKNNPRTFSEFGGVGKLIDRAFDNLLQWFDSDYVQGIPDDIGLALDEDIDFIRSIYYNREIDFGLIVRRWFRKPVIEHLKKLGLFERKLSFDTPDEFYED